MSIHIPHFERPIFGILKKEVFVFFNQYTPCPHLHPIAPAGALYQGWGENTNLMQ